MAGHEPARLTSLEVLALIRNSRPADLSAEQLAAVRAALAENPSLRVAAGGVEAVEQFLQEADAAATKAAAAEQPAPTPQQQDTVAPSLDASRARRLPMLMAVVGCLVLAGGYWLYSRVTNRQPATSTQEKQGQSAARTLPAVSGSEADPDQRLTWREWKIEKSAGAEVRAEWRWDLADPMKDRVDESLRVGRQPVTLSGQRQLSTGERWLVIDVTQTAQLPRAGTIEVRVDGKAISRFELPEIKADSHYAVLLPSRQGQAQLQVEFAPSGQDESVIFERLAVVEEKAVTESGTTIVPLLAHGPAPTLPGGKTIPYRPTPLVLFEDQGRFQSIPAPAASPQDLAEIVSDERYSGVAAVRATADGAFRLKLPQPLVIAQYPRQDQFRYVRFAVRANGGGRAVLELNHAAPDTKPARYDLGPGEPTDDRAFQAWDKQLPDGWIVVTRDLYRDVGQVAITDIAIRKLGGGEARFDHIYLARTLEQFSRTPQPPSAPLAMLDLPIPAGPVADAPERAIVALDAGDRVATGTIVNEEGYILTAAHLLAGPTKQIVAHFSDGTQQPCKMVCYRRDFNLGVVKIAGRPRYWPYLNMAHASLFGDKRHYRSFAFRFQFQPGDKPLAIHIPAHVPFAGRAQIGDVQWQLACGGPVLAPDGTIVGINTGPDMRGGLGYLPIEYARDNWQQLSTGVPGPGGDWDQYTRPVLGLAYEAIPNAAGLKVTAVDGNWPVGRSGVKVGDVIMLADGKKVTPFDLGIYVLKHEPGDTMTLTIRREEKEDLQIAVVLGRRP